MHCNPPNIYDMSYRIGSFDVQQNVRLQDNTRVFLFYFVRTVVVIPIEIFNGSKPRIPLKCFTMFDKRESKDSWTEELI